MLCECCDQFHCDGCGQTFCIDHLASGPEMTGPPMHYCGPCAAECEPLQLPARILSQSEVLKPLHLEAA